jgi:hypothetical protein
MWPLDEMSWAEVMPDGRLFSVAADRTVRVWPAEALLGGGS